MNRIHRVAFYLPQYHPIPENDEWWGKGFAKNINVFKGKAQVQISLSPNFLTFACYEGRDYIIFLDTLKNTLFE